MAVRKKAKSTNPKPGPRRWPPTVAELDRLIEQATVDAHDDEERIGGLFNEMENELKIPFEVIVLDVVAMVEGVDITASGDIVAVCRRGKARLRIPVQELEFRLPRPAGAEWIEAYRRFVVRWM